MTAVIPAPRPARTLLSPPLFGRLVDRIVSDAGAGPERAQRIMDQTLAFLAACASNPELVLVPSPTVDIGWHVFVLDTREYAAFCQDVVGRFVHHVPDEPGNAPRSGRNRVEARMRTLDAIERAGYVVDLEIWAPWAGGKCTPCHEEACSGSGIDGNENTETRNPKQW